VRHPSPASALAAAVLASLLAAALLPACGEKRFDRRGPSGQAAGEACSRAADCRAGLLCVSRRCASSLPAGACQPPGATQVVLGDRAGPDAAPDPITDPTCPRPVRPAVLEAGQVQELGVHAVGDTLSFQVAQGAPGFTVVSQEVEGSAVDEVFFGDLPAPNTVQPTDVFQPVSSAKFYDALAPIPADLTSLLAFYFGFVPSSGSFTVPNTAASLDLVLSEGGLPAGTWSFTLTDAARDCARESGCTGASAGGRYDVKVLTRPGPPAATGVLDLEVYLVTDRIAAADAAGDPATSSATRQLQRFVDGVRTTYARAGICLGAVTFHDLPGWAREQFQSLDIDGNGPCAPISQLFSLALDRNAVHLFLVEELVQSGSSDQLSVIGIDGSIPGPSGVPGTINSGAAVSIADLDPSDAAGACAGSFDLRRCGTDLVAYIAAHEAGHWLGLYHVTEQTGSDFDPLSDTPTCPCSECARGGQACSAPVGAASCGAQSGACAGAGNLMFWSIHPDFSAGSLSAQQGEVMRLNPAVR